MIIFETENFIVESHERAEVDRLEGGHIKVSPKVDVADRTQLSPRAAVELMRLTMVAGEAMKRAMAKIGVEIGRINYQENGNWKPHLHIHLYCRAVTATMQPYGEPITPGHKPEYSALTAEDVERIQTEITLLLQQEKYSDTAWSLA